MSTQGRTGSPSDAAEVSTGEAFIICASILALLIFFVILRFGVNICLDCFVLDASDRAWRSIAELFRKLCPWWHRRTLPNGPPPTSNDTELVTVQPSEDPIQRKQSLFRILPHSKLSSDSIAERRLALMSPPRSQQQGESASSSSSSSSHQSDAMDNDSASQTSSSCLVCSICLHELREGDSVFTARQCQHLFHFACITEWMSAASIHNDCPYCRTEILPRTVLRRILADRELQPEEIEAYLGVSSV